MGKVHEAIDGRLRAFIEAQHVFFVATAPLAADGHVNASPKGLAGSFVVVDERTVAYLDITASGAETIAHLRENGRITVMFTSFETGPNVVRLHGRGRVVGVHDDEYAAWSAYFPESLHGSVAARAVIVVDVERISDSCGYAVPLYEYAGERDLLVGHMERKGADGVAAYQREKNASSLDGLPALDGPGGHGAPRTNEHGQPIGAAVDWAPREPVRPVDLRGRWSRVEPVAAHHLEGLYDALVLRSPDSIWTYLSTGPFTERASFNAWLRDLHDDPAWLPHAICLADGRPVGIASYLRNDHLNGSVEVGGIAYAAELQRTTAATEAMYLMARHVFDDLGYRRYEWKCDTLNEPSRRAAERLGFRYEGTFRNALVYKGRNRDTAWFSITDAEWPAIRSAYDEWLDPANHDAVGAQRERLRARR